MPSVSIDYTEASQALALSPNTSGSPFVVSTPFGLSLLEIQGKLTIPTGAPRSIKDLDAEHMQTFVKVDDVRDAVKFGRLSFDEKDPSKVVLFVGTSQRLNGEVETLREPVALLKIPKVNEKKGDEKEKDIDGNRGVNMVDIIYKKIIFKHRPLPIM